MLDRLDQRRGTEREKSRAGPTLPRARGEDTARQTVEEKRYSIARPDAGRAVIGTALSAAVKPRLNLAILSMRCRRPSPVGA